METRWLKPKCSIMNLFAVSKQGFSTTPPWYGAAQVDRWHPDLSLQKRKWNTCCMLDGHTNTHIYILYYHTVHMLDTWHATNLLLGWIGGSCPQSRMSIWWTLPPVSGKSPHSCVNENDHSCVDPHVSIHMCRILPKMETQLEHCINGLHTMQYWCRPNVPSSRRTKTIEQPHARLSGYSVSGPPVNENV